MAASSSQQANLIDVDSTPDVNNQQHSRSPQQGSQLTNQKANTQPLCGHLNKLSGKGPLKGFKKRWFVFSPVNCRLNYYRNKGDFLQLGDIDVRKATFSLISPVNSAQQLAFKIILPDREYVLEGADSETTLNWIKELQRLRREFITESKCEPSSSSVLNPLRELHSRVAPPKPARATSNQAQPSSVFYDHQNSESSSWSQLEEAQVVNPVPHPTPNPVQERGRGGWLNRVKERAESMTRSPRRQSGEGKPSCSKCSELGDQLITINDDFSAVENELQASREVIQVLRKQIEIDKLEKDNLETAMKSQSPTISDDLLMTVSKSEREVGDVKVRLKFAEQELEKMKFEKEHLSTTNTQLNQELTVIKELLINKDETIINLTNENFELGSNSGMTKSMSGTGLELDQLRDSVRAYQLQNEFLSKELIEINELRTISEKRNQELQLKVHEWEAKCCQIQSKLLSLLKELNQDDDGDEDGQEEDGHPSKERTGLGNNQAAIKDLVNRLLEDCSLDIPLSWKRGNRPRVSTISSKSSSDLYDDMGFLIGNQVRDSNCEDNLEEQLRKRGEDLLKTEDVQVIKANWKARWDAYVGGLPLGKLLTVSDELKLLLRSGCPQEYRSKVWQGLVELRIGKRRQQFGSGYYHDLLTEVKEIKKDHTDLKLPLNRSLDPVVKQIELDLLRTLPNNRHFESLESDGTLRLRNVLTAFSRHNQGVGYCQGLNRLAAVSLLFMPEEDAFWTLIAIVEHIMPVDYYNCNLIGAHVDQYVFRDLLAEKLPRLHYHLEQLGVEISLFNWFLTCFVDNIPTNVYLRIWDVFLYEGSKVLFRFALAFLKLNEDQLIQLRDSAAINTLIRNLGQKVNCENNHDVNQLCKIAFGLLNPFPMSRVKSKRIHYTNLVKSELEQLAALRTQDRGQDKEREQLRSRQDNLSDED